MTGKLPAVDGIIPIVVTPFDAAGDIDRPSLARQVDYLITAGVRWVGVGYGSEIDLLTPQEANTLTGTLTEALDGRGGLLGNVEMAADTSETCRHIEAAARAGAHAVMLRPAPRESEVAMVRAVAAVARDAALDIVFQDAPQHTGVELSPETLARLILEIPGVVAVKVEPPTGATEKIGQVRQALGDSAGSIIGGLGGRDLVHELLRGGTGTMPGPAFPELFHQILHGVAQSDLTAAFRAWAQLLPFSVVADRDFQTFLWLNKYLLMRQGVIARTDLRNAGPIGSQLREDVDRLVDLFGGLT